MNKIKFAQYLSDNYTLSCSAQRLINNILDFVTNNYSDIAEQRHVLHELLDGTIGLSDNEINSLTL